MNKTELEPYSSSISPISFPSRPYQRQHATEAGKVSMQCQIYFHVHDDDTTVFEYFGRHHSPFSSL